MLPVRGIYDPFAGSVIHDSVCNLKDSRTYGEWEEVARLYEPSTGIHVIAAACKLLSENLSILCLNAPAKLERGKQVHLVARQVVSVL